MKAVKQYPGLYERNGKYHFRAVVPNNLRRALGFSEFKRSLGTDSLREARLRWAELSAEFERIKQEARDQASAIPCERPALSDIALSDVEPLVREWHAFRLKAELDTLSQLNHLEREDHARLARIKEAHQGYTDITHWRWRASAWSVMKHLCEKAELATPPEGSPTFNRFADRINAARADLARRVLKRLEDDFSDNPPGSDPSFTQGTDCVDVVNPGSREDATHSAKPLLLGEEIDRYVNDPARGVSEGTRKANRSRLRILEAYFDADLPIKAISSREMEAFRNVLLELPRDAFRVLPDIAVRDMPAVAKARGLQIVQRKNARLTFETISSFFKQLVVRGEIGRNPCDGLAIKKDRTEGKRRRPFNVDELQRVFSDPAHYAGAPDGARPKCNGAFWVPLIAAFTGMRLGEICQLWTDDVSASAGGVAYFRVRHDPDRKQTAKTSESERDVPVHRELIRLGFLHWVKAQQSDEPARLFPDIPFSKAGSASDIFSKRFHTRLKRLELGEGLVFHSFRHSFTDAMRNAGLSEAMQKAIGGWAAKDVHAQYGQGHSLQRLKEAIDGVWYEDETGTLDLSGIEPYGAGQ